MDPDAPPLDLGPHVGALLQVLPVALVVLDARGRVLLATAEEARLAGRDGPAAPGLDLLREVPPYAGSQELAAHLRRLVADEETDEGRSFMVPSLARGRELRLRLHRVDVAGRVLVVVLAEDDTRVREVERALSEALGRAQDEALRDPLTGLFNRRHMEATLPGELRRAERHGAPLSMMVLDLDHFKVINDTFGHPIGDRVLVEVAHHVKRILRVGDTCARVGGEEFCVCLPHTGREKAVLAAERLLRVIGALRFEDVPALRVTVSIGVASTSGARGEAEAIREVQRLFRCADQALYEAKRTGRDRTVAAGS